MLPFLKHKQNQTGVIVHTRQPDDPNQNEMSDLEMVAEDILRAINMKDIKGLAKALETAHIVCDKEVHTEGPHTEDSAEYQE